MSGSFNRINYDTCTYQQKVIDSTAPLQYDFYRGKYVNCNRCYADQSQYINLIDIESELKNVNRLYSKCIQFKYNPSCKFVPGSKNTCLSTFDPLVPVVLPPEICPNAAPLHLRDSGLRKVTSSGVVWPSGMSCQAAYAC